MEFEKFMLEDVTDVEKEIRKIIPAEPSGVYGMLEEYVFRG